VSNRGWGDSSVQRMSIFNDAEINTVPYVVNNHT
jgi:hypothetical protein